MTFVATDSTWLTVCSFFSRRIFMRMSLVDLLFPETPDPQLVSRHNWLLVVPIVGFLSTGDDLLLT